MSETGRYKILGECQFCGGRIIDAVKLQQTPTLHDYYCLDCNKLYWSCCSDYDIGPGSSTVEAIVLEAIK